MSIEEPIMATEETLLKTGKIWTWKTLLRDHTQFTTMLPGYLGSYISPFNSLPPKSIESIMLTMNSYNTCPYCTGLHGQLARMAGIDGPDENDPAVAFAKTFAIEAGRGADVDASYSKLIETIGEEKAKNVSCLCWALLWGKTTGNTINHTRDIILKLELKKVKSVDLFVFCYYGPLFLLIAALNASLKCAPLLSKNFSSALGAFLWVPQAIFIFPLGVLAIISQFGVV
jgi:AhpD family alkylhydroperoxidase